MRPKSFLFTLFLTLTLLFSLMMVSAQAASPGEVMQRIENQHRRINQGINEGSLTRREADMVLDNLEWIEGTFNRMQRDRILTPRELERLNHMLDRNSRMITREDRNFETVYGGNFEERIAEQQQRISDGIAKGELTRREADTVEDNLDWIRETFARMRQDGRLRAREMMRLDEMLDQNSQLIYKERHNFNERFREMYRDFH